MDYNRLMFVFMVTQGVFTALVWVYAWWVARSRATSEALHAMGARIDDNARRLDIIEKEQRDSPGHKDIHAVREDLSRLTADVREMNGTLRGMNRAVDLMSEHLLNRRGGD